MTKIENHTTARTAQKKLPSIPTLFHSVFQTVRVRQYLVWFLVSGVLFTLLSRLFVVIPPLFFIAMQSAEQTTMYSILIVMSVLLFCYFSVFSFALFLVVARRILAGQNIMVKASMVEAHHTVGRTALVIFLFGIFVILGSIALVIPGLVLAILFFFAPTISVLSVQKDHPFQQSRALFKGRFWAVLVRILIVYIFMIIPPYFLSKWNTNIGQVWGITTPFLSVFLTKIYLDIKQAAS